MKMIRIVLWLGWMMIPLNSLGASPEVVRSVTSRLERWEVEEAWGEVQERLRIDGQDPQLLELASQVAFYRGDYGPSRQFMRSAIEHGGDTEEKRSFLLFVEQTIGVLSSFQSYESPHFLIRLEEKQDGILVDYLIDGLEKSYQAMAEHYGFRPKEKIRVEIFPDTRAFYLTSTLSARDIEIAGAVGLAQFNKLMVLSPRALVYGYRWLDALSHEYLHYLIMKLTGNRAPIWFHEGLAKYEETRWRKGPSYLSPLNQTLLAQAVADGKLIPFERMEPSLIKLETPEEVQLAYAQAASAIEFILHKAGPDGLMKVMAQMARSSQRGAGEAIREVLGWRFPEFENHWKTFLTGKELKEVEGVNVRRFKIKERPIDEERLDLSEIKSLVARNRAHLGDLLRDRGRMEAAVLEYRRALREHPTSVPILNRLSGALIRMDRDPEALEIAQRALRVASDHPTVFSHLGKAYLKRKDWEEAKEALVASIHINPFNPEAHLDLATAYEGLGDSSAALRERAAARKLTR